MTIKLVSLEITGSDKFIRIESVGGQGILILVTDIVFTQMMAFYKWEKIMNRISIETIFDADTNTTVITAKNLMP